MRNWFVIALFVVLSLTANAQCPNPILVDLTSSPSAVFSNSYSTIGPLSSSTTCCPNIFVSGERCIKFSITLNQNAGGIKFEMSPGVSGGVFHIDCGANSYNVGNTVCIQGQGPHELTFCNPSQITSLFKISSIPKATAGADIYVSQGCSKTINASGFDSTSVTWSSLTNNPNFNSYLSCTNCLHPTITPGISPPSYVDYKICGNTPCGQICDTIRVNFTPPLSVTISPQNPAICNSQTPNSTSISAIGNGGSGNYTYLWNNINIAQSITVPAGYYTVVISDGTGCTASSMVEVKKFNVPVSVDAGPPKTVCRQTPTTMLSGTVSGAYGGVWSGGSGTFSPNNSTLNATYTPSSLELSTGTVTLTLTSTGNGSCQAASDQVTLTYDNFSGVITATPIATNCYGSATGGANVNVVGGSPPYTYLWNSVPPQGGASVSNLAIGTYTVTVSNSFGCTSTATATVTQPPIISLASNLTNVSCAGLTNGALSVISAGGTPPFTYLWQPGGATVASINNKQAGTYSVTVTDSKGCIQQSTYTINQPPAISISFSTTLPSCYNGTDGKIVSTVSGGTPPYTYNWSSGSTSPTANGLAAGTYTLTVTDILGCSASGNATIGQPAVFSANTSTINETCNYSNDGSANVTVNGGTPGYSYLWQPGGSTSTAISNLAAGTYTVTATDSKGCIATGFAIVSEPAAVNVNFISQINVSCFSGNDGMVTANPSGGTPPYSYSWTPSGTTTSTISQLSAGSYSVNVTDSKGCTTTNSIAITQPLAPLSVSNFSVTDVSCNSGHNGSITVNPTGGTPPYSYLWQPGNQTSSVALNLGAGTYSLTLKDSKGCQIVTNYTVNQPGPVSVVLSTVSISCSGGNDGTVQASASGGKPPYFYLWTPSGSTNNTVSSLSAGTYSVTVTDSLGCNTSSSINLTAPSPILPNATITNVVCSGGNSGSIVLSPSGGTLPYSYLWSLGSQTTSSINNLSIGNYSVVITDGNGCQKNDNYTISQLSLTILLTPNNVSCFGGNDGSIGAVASGGTPNFSFLWTPGGATTNSISNLAAGTYTLSITDSKGCVAENYATITSPSAITLNLTSTNKTCSNINNGTATVIANGGTPGYSYIWQPGLQTSSAISNLASGTYTVTLTDSKGCRNSSTTVINQPATVNALVISQSNVTNCFGGNNGSLSGGASGGTPPYSFQWNPGNLSNSTISNLTAGTYTLTVSDSNGCNATNTATLIQPTSISAVISKTDETCNYLNNGTASVTASGGTSPYSYSWLPGGATTSSINNLSAGTYSVTITDVNGCNISKSVTIAEPTAISINISNKVNVRTKAKHNE